MSKKRNPEIILGLPLALLFWIGVLAWRASLDGQPETKAFLEAQFGVSFSDLAK